MPVGHPGGDGAGRVVKIVELEPCFHWIVVYDAVARSRSIEPTAVRIDERRTALDVGESKRHSSGVSAASQGMDAETQWVSRSSWSLLCRCRGGVTNVA
jgi:hypothetical protein